MTDIPLETITEILTEFYTTYQSFTVVTPSGESLDKMEKIGVHLNENTIGGVIPHVIDKNDTTALFQGQLRFRLFAAQGIRLDALLQQPKIREKLEDTNTTITLNRLNSLKKRRIGFLLGNHPEFLCRERYKQHLRKQLTAHLPFQQECPTFLLMPSECKFEEEKLVALEIHCASGHVTELVAALKAATNQRICAFLSNGAILDDPTFTTNMLQAHQSVIRSYKIPNSECKEQTNNHSEHSQEKSGYNTEGQTTNSGKEMEEKYENRFALKAQAITTIQAKIRERLTRRQFERIKTAVQIIKKFGRTMANKAKKRIEEKSIVILQTAARCYVTKTRLVQAKGAAIKIQTFIRDIKHQRLVTWGLRKVQAAVRGKKANKRYKEIKRSIATVQAQMRGYLTRSKQKQITKIAITIQTAVRQKTAQKKFQAIKEATMTIQKWIRWKRKEKQNEGVIKAIVRLQAKIRQRQAARKRLRVRRSSRQTSHESALEQEWLESIANLLKKDDSISDYILAYLWKMVAHRNEAKFKDIKTTFPCVDATEESLDDSDRDCLAKSY